MNIAMVFRPSGLEPTTTVQALCSKKRYLYLNCVVTPLLTAYTANKHSTLCSTAFGYSTASNYTVSTCTIRSCFMYFRHTSFSLHFQVDSVSGGGSQSVFAELESQVFALKSEAAKMESTERQLMDRNAALEEQLSESMGAVKDQSKLNVSQLQQDREELVMRYEAQLLELQEQLKMATKERDSLLANRERVTAQWEGRIRRLEQQLKAYQEGNTPAEVSS